MNLTKSSNPALSNSVFSKVQTGAQTDVMTIEGTVNKTGLMFLILAFAAAFTWRCLVRAIPTLQLPFTRFSKDFSWEDFPLFSKHNILAWLCALWL